MALVVTSSSAAPWVLELWLVHLETSPLQEPPGNGFIAIREPPNKLFQRPA